MNRSQAKKVVEALDVYLSAHDDTSAREALVAALSGGEKEGKQFNHPDDIIRRVGKAFSISREEMLGTARPASMVRARHVAMFLLREQGHSFPEIAKCMKRLDHTTIIHAVKAITEDLKTDTRLAEVVNELRASLLMTPANG